MDGEKGCKSIMGVAVASQELFGGRRPAEEFTLSAWK
jgi:hypothetical protein